MNTIILARINLAEKFASNVREEIRFLNNAVANIQAKIDKLNEEIKCPKWSVSFTQTGNNYFISLIEDDTVANKIIQQYKTCCVSNKHVAYVDNDKQYTFTSFSLRDKLRRKILTTKDIDTHLARNEKKLKSRVRAIAKNYGFKLEAAMMDKCSNDELEIEKLSIA